MHLLLTLPNLQGIELDPVALGGIRSVGVETSLGGEELPVALPRYECILRLSL
jgi:hypothetical protein